MARAMGIDPETRKYVPFDITDKKFATNYLDLVIRPLERQGVDFWWLDWQQWGSTKIPGVTPTWWLNYVFFTDMERRDSTRPLLFHRWGGLGNHRYQIGFSGDAISVWPSLAFQPYFTSTAANVGYGYWSHDIGGHMPGEVSAELYTRWIQFGIFSPIIRTHTTKNPKAERRMWAYPTDYFSIMKEMVRLRYEMIPYIYTEARKAYDSGVSLCRPMYYSSPESPEAYSFTDQYMFGENMIVAPVATPVDTASVLAEKEVWLPDGSWYEWFTGRRIDGPAVVKHSFAIDEVPVYLKAGSIVPLQPAPVLSEGSRMRQSTESRIELLIAPGDSGTYALYDDQGNSPGYQRGEFARTSIDQETEGPLQSVTIGPMIGEYDGKPETRVYSLRLPGTLPPLTVTCDGMPVAHGSSGPDAGWWYDGARVTTIISLPATSTDRRTQIIIRYPADQATTRRLVGGVPAAISRLRTAMTMINSTWPAEWSPDVLVHAVQTGNRLSLNPDRAMAELGLFQEELPKTVAFLQTLAIEERVKRGVAAHLREIGER
jgi:alpha-glucosidase